MAPDAAFELQRAVILIVDDSPETLSLLTDALEQSGATVLVAVAGDFALTLVEETTPDVILLDAMMPGMDGFETCRRLKAKSHIAPVPVIFMTGLSETRHIIMGLEAGGIDYVTKPVAPEEVIARIRVHLANARLSRRARAALDTTGRTLFAVDSAGIVLWSTPQAAQVLMRMPDALREPLRLPREEQDWLQGCLVGSGTHARTVTDSDGNSYLLNFIGSTADEILLRLARDITVAGLDRLRERLPLSSREAEVLFWLWRGKSSQDIAVILGLSPRTVMKHLESIYTKLGVENRVAAANVASKYLRDLE